MKGKVYRVAVRPAMLYGLETVAVRPAMLYGLETVAVRPAMLYGLETVALTKRQEMEVAELKMLRFSLGVTRMDKSGMSTSEGQHRWDGLERKHERRD